MSRIVKLMKPHLAEINVLRGILSTFSEWISQYNKIMQVEDCYHSLYLSTQGSTRSFYKKKYIKVSKRLALLTKRLDFKSMQILFDKISTRINGLYQLDKELQRESLME